VTHGGSAGTRCGLFSAARFDGLDGLPFPGDPRHFPTKDEMGDYLEAYARHFQLPVRNGVRVESLSRSGERYLATSGAQRFLAREVVVAMADYQKPRTPAFASELDPSIVQLHSSAYKRPAQLRAGPVLLVGAGNSGAEIAMELRQAGHPVLVAGPDVGKHPGWFQSSFGQNVFAPLLFRGIFHRLLTESTPAGRKVKAKGEDGDPSDPDSAQAPRRRRGGARRTGESASRVDGRCSRMAGARRAERPLEHRVPRGVLVDPRPGVRRAREPAPEAGSRRAAGPVLRRASLPVRDVVVDDSTAWDGTRSTCREDRPNGSRRSCLPGCRPAA
jgi:hypothetical protein